MQAPPSHAVGIHTALLTSATAGRPLTGVFVTLADQHRQVLELLRHAGAVEDAALRQERWVEARRRLLSHERAEATVVYAALEGVDTADTLLHQHTQQALELETAIQDLDEADAESDQWIERLRDVMALVDDHVRDEETDFFQRAQRLLGENTARDLDERFASVQRDVLHSLS
jgi:hemerythrin superfamily protein